MLRLAVAVALRFHWALLLVPSPTRSVAVAHAETTPGVHLVPLPQLSAPPPANAIAAPQPQIHLPFPGVHLLQGLHGQGGGDAPATVEPHPVG